MWYSTMFWRWSDSFDSSGRVKFGSKFLPILIFESIFDFGVRLLREWAWILFFPRFFSVRVPEKNLGTFFLEGEYLVGNLGMNVILGPSIRWMEVLPQSVDVVIFPAIQLP